MSKYLPINYKFIWLTIFFIIIFLGGEASPQISFYVSPPLLEIDQVGGGLRNFIVEISNTGQEKIQVKTIFSDLFFDSEGKVQLMLEGTTSYSLTSWITTNIEEFTELNPGEIKKIPLQLRVPRGERGGRYGVIVFEALPSTIPQGKVSLGIRSGTLVFLTISRTEEVKGTIEDVISSTDGKEFKVIFKNTGNVHYETEGSLIIKSEDGKVLHRIRFPEDKPSMILPQGKREFIVLWDKRDPLSEGKYLLEARVSAWVGDRILNLDRKEFTVELITSLNEQKNINL
ncbi:hypothetical protein [Atribacter laminatus]|uniref:hypothetical protein n=1 Tax=Atribacter laminatus TaxID=2847778 RepID=UPI001C401FE8|nr:hypothetical protein [Atribacter laminatus]